jgi:hypothetical protein
VLSKEVDWDEWADVFIWYANNGGIVNFASDTTQLKKGWNFVPTVFSGGVYSFIGEATTSSEYYQWQLRE